MAGQFGLPENTGHLYGRRALAIARLMATMAEHPHRERFTLYVTPGGPKRGGQIRVTSQPDEVFQGELLGTYTRDVTAAQLLDDLAHLDAAEAAC